MTGFLQRTSERRNYGYASAVVMGCTALSWLMSPYFGPANLIMVYLFGVVVIATRWGRGPSALASLMSVAAFDFFFIPPYYSFAVSDVQYLLTFAVMLVVALLISRLASHKSQQAEAASIREQRTAALYAMSRELITQRGVENWLPWRPAISTTSSIVRWRCFFLIGTGGCIFIEATRCISTWIRRRPESPNGSSTIKNPPVTAPIPFLDRTRCICRCRVPWCRSVSCSAIVSTRRIARPGPAASPRDLRESDGAGVGTRAIGGRNTRSSRAD